MVSSGWRRECQLASDTYLDAKDVSDEAINDVLAYKSKHTTYVNLLGTYKRFQLFLQARSRSRIDEVFRALLITIKMLAIAIQMS